MLGLAVGCRRRCMAGDGILLQQISGEGPTYPVSELMQALHILLMKQTSAVRGNIQQESRIATDTVLINRNEFSKRAHLTVF